MEAELMSRLNEIAAMTTETRQEECWNCHERFTKHDDGGWPGYCPNCKVDGCGHVKACETATAYIPTRCRNRREH